MQRPLPFSVAEKAGCSQVQLGVDQKYFSEEKEPPVLESSWSGNQQKAREVLVSG